MNGYLTMYRGKRLEVRAETSRQAQQIAAKQFRARKEYEVDVYLCERQDGSEVKQSTCIG